MRTICSAIKNCWQRCFRNEEDEYRNRMIQLQQRMLNRSSQKRESLNVLFNPMMSSPQRISSFDSPLKNIEVDQPETKPSVQQPVRASNTSVDSYYTINSGSNSSHSVSRRTFKSMVRKKSIMGNSEANSSKVSEFKEFKQLSMQNGDPIGLKLSRVQSQYNSISEAMFEWNQKQYERSTTNTHIQITTTQQLKLSSNIMLNEAINKLEDFYTFYFNEMNNRFVKDNKQEEQLLGQYQGHCFKKYPMFKCYYYSEHDNINAADTYMLLMTFQSNTSNPVEFLQWYNSTMVQSRLFNFQSQKIIQNGTYPVFEIDQFSSDIREKYNYITVRQIQNVKFDNQPDTQYVLQLDTTFRKGNYFKSLVRFSDSDNGLVEIYCQCSEKIKSQTSSYFIKRWKNLQGLIKDRLLKISVSRVIK